MRKTLNDKSSLANSVRIVNITLSDNSRHRWIFNDPNFISISQLLSKSLRPPHYLQIYGGMLPYTFNAPKLIVGRLTQTFFSRTLTILRLLGCEDVPLTLFLICPRLKKIFLNGAYAYEESYSKFPDEQCSGRELPTLDTLEYCNSESIVKEMITPPSRFNTGVVLWSELRVLRLRSHKVEERTCLQPILDLACNSLEELYLTMPQIGGWGSYDELHPINLVKLKNLSCLHVFTPNSIIKCGTRNSVVVRDINIVLNTIPKSNQVSSLTFVFGVHGKRPFRGCLANGWGGLCDQIVRISGGKHLQLNLHIGVAPPGQEDLCKHITEKITLLSEYPNIHAQINGPSADFDYDSEM